MTRIEFPSEIRSAILAAAEAAPIQYAVVTFDSDEDGQPIAAIGRWVAHEMAPDVQYDFTIGVDDGCVLWGDMLGNILGSADPRQPDNLRHGLSTAIWSKWFPPIPKRRRRARSPRQR